MNVFGLQLVFWDGVLDEDLQENVDRLGWTVKNCYGMIVWRIGL